MRLTERVFLVSVFAGVGCLLAGMLLTRLNWRPDVRPFGFHSRVLDITVHPEKYATPRVVPLIRALNLAGACLIALAAFAVVREIVRTMRAPGSRGWEDPR